MSAVLSPVVNVRDALVAALSADADLAAWLAATADDARVYGRHVAARLEDDDGNPWPYLVVRGFGEDETATFGPGVLFDTHGTVRAWAPGDDETLPLEGYAHVRRVLSAPVAVAGYAVLRCDVRLDHPPVTDPDGRATQAIVRVDVTSQAAP